MARLAFHSPQQNVAARIALNRSVKVGTKYICIFSAFYRNNTPEVPVACEYFCQVCQTDVSLGLIKTFNQNLVLS